MPLSKKFETLAANLAGVDNFNKVTKQNFKAGMAGLDISRKAARKAIRGLGKYQKKRDKGADYNFNDDGTYGINDAEGFGYRGSGIRKGNQKGFGAGDLLNIGSDVSNFAGVLGKHRAELDAKQRAAAEGINIGDQEFDFQGDFNRSAEEYSTANKDNLVDWAMNDPDINNAIEDSAAPEEEADEYIPLPPPPPPVLPPLDPSLDPSLKSDDPADYSTPTIIQDGLGDVEIPFKVDRNSSPEIKQRAKEWYNRITQSGGYDPSNPPVARQLDEFFGNEPAGVGEGTMLENIKKDLSTTFNTMNEAQFLDYINKGGINAGLNPSSAGTVTLPDGTVVNAVGGFAGEGAGIGPAARFLGINTNPSFGDNEIPIGDAGRTYNDLISGFTEDLVPVGTSRIIPGAATPQKLLKSGNPVAGRLVNGRGIQQGAARIEQGQVALPVARTTPQVQPVAVSTNVTSPVARTVNVSPKGTANVNTSSAGTLSEQLASKLSPKQLQKELDNLTRAGRKRGTLSDGTRVQKTGKAGNWKIYTGAGIIGAAGLIGTSDEAEAEVDATASPNIYKKSNVIQSYGLQGKGVNNEGVSVPTTNNPGVRLNTGNNIRPVKGGEITAIGVTPGMGTSIIVLHDDGSRTVYTGISKESLKVKKGQIIDKNTILGDPSNNSNIMLSLWDSSGKTTKNVDPSRLLLKKGGKLKASNLL